MLRQSDRAGLRTWIELDRRALARNLRQFRRILPPGCRIMAVCKSNAYGHGLYDLAPRLEELGVDWFGVDSVVEAVTLREKGIRRPLLVLGYTLPSRFEDAGRHDFSLTISSLANLRALARHGGRSRIKVHLKLDTGMHRQGLLRPEWPAALDLLKKAGARTGLEGLYTHFAAAKDPNRGKFTRRQIREFDEAAAFFRAGGLMPLLHAGATAGALNYPEARYDLVRIGIGLMGLWPSPETRLAWEKELRLRPALTWRSLISETKKLSAGEAIGYNLTDRLGRDSTVGVCPIGYWHGFPRSLGRVAEVLVRGRRAKILGAVSMDMIVIDLTGIPGARAGDVVTLIGRDGAEEISACEVARKAGVSHYELLTRLNPLIQKFHLG
ncbi:MAG: alanine racemase [Candidatus Aminicenantes bacterium RBG_16_63_16]|nr:MAG: alanine racemase [Candidatus Aminicenantes bacterium RBG_16_63_16]